MERAKHNALSQESSPYLLSHADQPVNWMPWGEFAFEKAQEEGKPILLSIGYSSCHWCHVMAREAFSDFAIAEYLNQQFICIKLDREERPEVDTVYMNAHLAMHNGSGGWPLNIFLTPNLLPFYSGTYFPAQAGTHKAGFDEILRGVLRAWTENQEGVLDYSQVLMQELGKPMESRGPQGEIEAGFLAKIQNRIYQLADQQELGWGAGPKFPQPALLRFLLLSENTLIRNYAIQTCVRMAESGLYDHINGGFHRYCVDREWIIPHFEKMLSDQALLIELYLDAYCVTLNESFATVAHATCEYVIRELINESGSFSCAQDAQSEGKEGKFSCWTLTELSEIFSSTELKLLREHFDLSMEGNFHDFSDPLALMNQNVLVVRKELEHFCTEDQIKLRAMRNTMFEVRARRQPPLVDRKILLDWNAMMISALTKASRILGEKRYLKVAILAYKSLMLSHQQAGIYYHSVMKGKKSGRMLSYDLASMLRATRILYQHTFLERYLLQCKTLAKMIVNRYYDSVHGGFYDTEANSGLVLRTKGEFDAALPCVSSVMLRELTVLGALCSEGGSYNTQLEQTISYFYGYLQNSPQNLGSMLLSLAQKEILTVVSSSREMNALIFEEKSLFAFSFLLRVTSNHELLPKGAAAIVCQGSTCFAPVKNVPELRALLITIHKTVPTLP